MSTNLTLVLTAAAAVWMGITARYTLRGSPWTRATATVWQLLQLGDHVRFSP